MNVGKLAEKVIEFANDEQYKNMSYGKDGSTTKKFGDPLIILLELELKLFLTTRGA